MDDGNNLFYVINGDIYSHPIERNSDGIYCPNKIVQLINIIQEAPVGILMLRKCRLIHKIQL